jgi:hypothetical protein
VDATEGIADIDGREPDECREACSGVDADANDAAAWDISLSKSEGEIGDCLVSAFGMRRACVSGAEARIESGE